MVPYPLGPKLKMLVQQITKTVKEATQDKGCKHAEDGMILFYKTNHINAHHQSVYIIPHSATKYILQNYNLKM